MACAERARVPAGGALNDGPTQWRAMATYQHHERIDTPTSRTGVTLTRHRTSPGQVVGTLTGLVLAVIGIVVLVRTGIDTTMNQPVTDVLGNQQSAYVGAFETVMGLLIVAASTSIAYRGSLGFLGALTLVAGVVVVASSDRILLDIGASRDAGTVGIVIGAVALLASMLPSFVRSERTVDTDVDPV